MKNLRLLSTIALTCLVGFSIVAMEEQMTAAEKAKQEAAYLEKVQLNNKQIPLFDAIRVGDLTSIRAELAAGARADLAMPFILSRGTPLQYAYEKALENKLAVMELLLENRANKRDLDQFLIMEASIADAASIEMVKWLLKNGAQDTNGDAVRLARQQMEYMDEETQARFQTVIDLINPKK